MSRYERTNPPRKKTQPRATTPEARESQLIAKAVDLAEQQLDAGTASVAVITHFLKLGTIRESVEREKLELEKELLKARTDGIESTKRSEVMYQEVIDAMRTYTGSSDDSNL